MELSTVLNGLVGAGFASMVLAGVAAIRRYKSGEIVDDDAIIARLDRDNEKLRKEKDDALEKLEKERRARWRAEDIGAKLRRRLLNYEEVNDE